MTGGKTRLVCLLGKPARHSLSPRMHNAGYGALGLDFVYLAFEPKDLEKAVDGLKELEAAGFNVTMPFKSQILKHLDSIDPIAKKIGAVNTVVNRNGKLKGYNTDGPGAIAAIKKVTEIKGKRVLLIGAGGAGRAIGFYLKRSGAKTTIADRTHFKAEKLAGALRAKNIGIEKIDNLADFDIIINASPSGMHPNTGETPLSPQLLESRHIVFDIVYDPPETKFLSEAKAKGCVTINGLEMLLGQGFEGFRLFTGRDAPRNAMEKAVTEAFASKH
ncbi:MAG TPA: shikimate dehydrogenase [Candidatus Diapherotrites archaeon]|uniref:Shikimate dehydrogenase (NADP(+)) n=1 Tax=Candidatus Iainarchaeum sp. TaxID=3101447 RepID=A0A7J4J083_9ARCH|nr:shikimate dehydrogenase [Candidatus Diapherotrites archaeon]